MALGLSLMPLIAAFAPRFLAFAPGIMVVAGLMLYRSVHGRWPLFSKPLFIWFSAITGFCAFSAIWGIGDSMATLERTAGIGLILFSGLGLLALCNSSQRDDFIRFFPVFFLGAALICLIDLYSGGCIYRLLHGGETGGFNPSRLNRSIVAITLMSFPAFVAAWHRFDEKRQRYSAVIAIFIVICAILYKTDSQSAQFSFIAGIMFFAFFPYQRRIAWIGLALGMAALVVLSPFLAQWMFSALAAAAHEDPWLARGYAADRMEIWDFVARKALESPIWGFGLEATREIEHFDARRLYTPLDHVLHPHNAVLQIWIEFGAIGAAMASGFMAFILRALYRQGPAMYRLGLPVFMAVLAGAAVSYGLWQGWWLGLFLVLAAFCRILSGAENSQL